MMSRLRKSLRKKNKRQFGFSNQPHQNPSKGNPNSHNKEQIKDGKNHDNQTKLRVKKGSKKSKKDNNKSKKDASK